MILNLNDVLRLSLLRAPYDPAPLPVVGKHQVRLAILPYTGKLSKSQAILKLVEDGAKKNLLLRLFNPEYKDATITVEISQLSGKLVDVFACDLMERQESHTKLLLVRRGNTFKIRVLHHERFPLLLSNSQVILNINVRDFSDCHKAGKNKY